MFWRKKIFNMMAVAAFLLAFASMGMAGTYSDFVSDDMRLARPALEPVQEYVPFIHYRVFDFGDPGINGGSGVTNGDVIELFNTGKNTIIEEFGIRITTAASYSGVSAEVGDGTNIDGFVGHDISVRGVPFIDLSNANSEVSRWNLNPFPMSDSWADSNASGASNILTSGVSRSYMMGSGITTFNSIEQASNHGPFFSSGASPYIGKDTIDMTIYTGSNVYDSGGAAVAGVTPMFEAYIKGFKRISN